MKSSIVINPNAFRAELFKCFFHYRRLQVHGKNFIAVPAVSDNEYLVSIFKEDEMADLRYHDQPPLINAYFNHYMEVNKAIALRSLDVQDYYRYYFAESCYIVSLMEKFVPNENPIDKIFAPLGTPKEDSETFLKVEADQHNVLLVNDKSALGGVEFYKFNQHPKLLDTETNTSIEVLCDLNGERKDFRVGWYDFDDKQWRFHDTDRSSLVEDKLEWCSIPFDRN